ncbi:MAG: hypothetical protein JEY99_16375 [Spirochaetales bacterium]|nr:hypothetical protein [Spirochaetales bacterium]
MKATAPEVRGMVPEKMYFSCPTGKKVIVTHILLLIFMSASISLFSEELDLESWYKEETRSEAYQEIHRELTILINSIEETEIPVSLLMEKLREGSSKRVPARRLLLALNEEVNRLRIAEQILSESDVVFKSINEETSLYRGISILLAGGLSEKTIQTLIRTNNQTDNRTDSFIAAGHALLGVQAVAPLSRENIQRLGEALVESELPFQMYSAITSLFLKGMVQRLQSETILEIIIDILNHHGGIVQIERELNRRSSRR